jgi:cobalt-zinc-cadmium resistance protein CzcA
LLKSYALYTIPVEAFPTTNNQVVTEAPSLPPSEIEQLVTSIEADADY